MADKMRSGKAVVVGSGIAGLAMAIRLAVKGYEVEIFEANTYPGGKLTEIAFNGFRFDAGPSLFTMPWLVDELFALAGEKPSQYFIYERLPEITRYFYEDGTRITSFAEPSCFAHEVEAQTGEPAAHVVSFLEKSENIFNITSSVFLESSLHDVATYFASNTLKAGLQLHKLDAFRTMHGANSRAFNDERVVQLFNRYATYNGSDPYLAPATLNVIPHLEFNTGAYFPKGGMHHITQSMFDLANRLGVKFHFGTPIKQIVVKADKAVGVQTDVAFTPADLVVSNMDAINTYRKLLPNVKAPDKSLAQPRSTSAFVFYWGINKKFSQLGLHNVFFSADYKEEFRYLSELKTVYNDPTIYLNISSKLAPTDAPQDMENWFVMINVPPNSGQDWESIKAKAKQDILRKLCRILQEDIEPLIIAEDVLDPILMEQRTSSYQGALYGGDSNGRFAAFMRPANFHSSVRGLYFCGGSVHPGGGIPLCLLSARIVSQLIDKREPL
ncbi:phytoene desaturase family protein [soil metagenome]